MKSIKRLLSILISILIISTALPLCAQGAEYSGSCGENLNWYLNAETGDLVFTGSGDMKAYSSSKDFPWYEYRSNIRSVTIPEGLTSIHNSAFYSCPNLTDVYYLGDLAGWCNIYFSEAYSNPLIYADNLYIDGELVEGDIVIPDGVTSIPVYAFNGCSGITSIDLPDGLRTIGYSAFDSCTSLKSINIPDTVSVINEYTFYNCSKLENIDIPDRVYFIGEEAFSGCRSLANIEMGQNVKTIDDFAFANCDSLTSIILPDKLETIGEEAFAACKNLTTLTIGSGIKTICQYAFSGCTGLKDFYFNGEADDWCKLDFYNFQANPVYHAENFYLNGKLAKDVVITDNVEVIGKHVFYGADIENLTISQGVKYIGDYAFYDCNKINEITIPDSVTYLGAHSFSSCEGAESLTIGEGVTTIGAYAFAGCSGLTNVKISDNLKWINSRAFINCSSIKELTLPVSARPESDTYAFDGCTGVEKVIFTKGTGIMPDFECTGTTPFNSGHDTTPWYLSRANRPEIIFEDGIENIGNYAFHECNLPESLELPESIESIGIGAFKDCQGLDKLIVHNPDCEFEYFCISSGTTLYGYANSTAQTYAKNNNLNFKFIACADNNHVYDNSCDPDCNVCTYTRTDLVHTDENNDKVCDNCELLISDIFSGETVNVPVHAGDTGYLKFIPQQTGVYTIYSVSDEDVYGYVCDKDLSVLEYNDDDGENQNFSITYSFEENIVYYFAVRFKDGSAEGNVPVVVRFDEETCLHNKTSVIRHEATCTQSGNIKTVCSFCGEVLSNETIPATGHTEIRETLNEPSCTEPGSYRVICHCGVVLSQGEIPATGHNNLSDVIIKEPTCTQYGVKKVVCFCGEFIGEESIAPNGHNLQESILAEPTCTEIGISLKVCSECDYTARTVISATGHKTSEVSTIQPTCIKDGYHKETCSCGSIIVSETLPATGHSVSETVTVPPSCTISGYEQTLCSCGYVISQNEIPATGHEISETITTEPTCIKDGSTQFICSCGYVMREEITPATNHSLKYSIITLEPTCTQNGIRQEICSCGYVISEETVPAINHANTYDLIIKNPTCTEDGSKQVICSDCRFDLGIVTIPATGHVNTHEVTKNPTCTAEGYTKTVCKCGETVGDIQIIPATGHVTLREVVVVNETCTGAGLKNIVCSCGEVIEKNIEIPATGHTETKEVIVIEATCTEDGFKRIVCKECSVVLSSEILPPTGHNYSVTSKAPTCTGKGYEIKICKNCGDKINNTFDPLGHSYGDWTIITEPTETTQGSRTHSCTACNKSETGTIPVIKYTLRNTTVIDYSNDSIYGLDAGIKDLENYINLSDSSCYLEYEREYDYLGTGSKVRITDGTKTYGEFTIIIFGDINGDGWYDGMDSIFASCYINSLITDSDITVYQKIAADCNHNGMIDTDDVRILREAGNLVSAVDQSKTHDELSADSAFVEYSQLIEQAPEIEDEPSEEPTASIIEILINWIISIIRKLFGI